MKLDIQRRFEAYCEELAKVLYAERSQAERCCLGDVRSAYQTMHHLVAHAEWSDEALLATVAGLVIPVLTGGGSCTWFIDDAVFPKNGRGDSVGVARQYCEQAGKADDCRIAVSLSLGTRAGTLPLSYRLYLPREWTDDPQRCLAVGVPEMIAFATKNEIAREQIEVALKAGIPRGTVLGSAAYGDDTALRDWLSQQGLLYVLGVHIGTTVWWGEYQPVVAPIAGKRGKTKIHLARDENHQPIEVLALAKALPSQCFRTVTWRQGASEPLRSRFARVRVRAAYRNLPRKEEWLIIEWPKGEAEPTHYWMSTHPKGTTFVELVDAIKARWRFECDYQKLMQEFGLGHYEGRNWRGFHHHASLCIAAYGFLMREHLSETQKSLLANAGVMSVPVAMKRWLNYFGTGSSVNCDFCSPAK